MTGKVISGCKEFLEERMDPDFGLLNKLRSRKVLSDKDIDEIKTQETYRNKNLMIIDKIVLNEKFEELIEALKDTQQSHIANYLIANGEFRTEFGGEWPLSEKEISILDANEECLIDLLETCDLLPRLYSVGVINKRQREYISSKQTYYEKNEELLKICKRGSLSSYWQTNKFLRDTNQSHIAQIFENGGVLVQIDTTLAAVGADVDEAERQLATEITRLLGDRSLTASSRILEFVQMGLVAAKKGHSVALYFYCLGSRDVDKLQDMCTNGELKNIIEMLFNRVLAATGSIKVKIKRIARCSNRERSFRSELMAMEQLYEDTECCICTEMFTDPRMLPCIHTFCLKCLEAIRTSSENNSEDTMPCPICRQQFTIPPDGLRGLQKNFFMDRLMEITKISKPLKTTVSCDVCLVNKYDAGVEVHDASKYCVQCQENMCESCSVQHKRQKLSKGHQIVAFGSRLKDELVKTSMASYCSQHKKKELKMYCADCKKVICMMCFTESHKMHKCSDVHKVADGFRNEIDMFIAKMVEGSKEGLERKVELDGVKGKFLEELKMAEDAIKVRATELKQLIDKHAKVLVDELVQIKLTRMKEIDNENEDIERHLTIFNSFNAYCSELRSKGTPVDICRSVDDLCARAKELQEVNSRKKKEDLTTVQVSFKSSTIIEEMLKTENTVGSLEVKQKSLATLKTNKDLSVFSDVIKIFQCSPYVEAVTKVDDKIYVLCSQSLQSWIELHIFEDRDPFRIYKKVRIEDIKRYIRVASSDKFRCLYIWDVLSKCVWRLMADDLKLTKWLSKVSELIVISTSNDGLLMLLRDDKGLKKFETYGQDAKISRSIALSRDIENPICFVQEANGKFIVIHESDKSENRFWVISELSYEGQILRQFKPKDKHQELKSPSFLCLDSLSDRLFVAETDDTKLTLVIFNSPSLEREHTLLLSEGCSYRFFLHYDSRKRQLLVGRKYEVVVYQIH